MEKEWLSFYDLKLDECFMKGNSNYVYVKKSETEFAFLGYEYDLYLYIGGDVLIKRVKVD